MVVGICGYPITRRVAGMGRDIGTYCDKPAKWYHADGCGSKYRCTKHTYRNATGRACTCCGNDVTPINKGENHV